MRPRFPNVPELCDSWECIRGNLVHMLHSSVAENSIAALFIAACMVTLLWPEPRR
jgi:hypothetical protein